MKDFSYITHSHPAFIESLYNDFTQDPQSVDPEFRKFFEGFDFAVFNGNGKNESIAPAVGTDSNLLAKEFGVYNLIQAYRRKGHLIAKTNPIRERKNRGANLELKYFGLSEGIYNKILQRDNLLENPMLLLSRSCNPFNRYIHPVLE
jgi:2-oxoglutarate dehydrogenase E1 component